MKKSNLHCSLSHMNMAIQNETDYCSCNVNTDKLDAIRGQSFKDAFPEWWDKLEPYWYNYE